MKVYGVYVVQPLAALLKANYHCSACTGFDAHESLIDVLLRKM